MELSMENYNNLNDKSKEDIVGARKAHDQLMDMLVITTIVCQHELFKQTASELEDIVNSLPQNKVVIIYIYNYYYY